MDDLDGSAPGELRARHLAADGERLGAGNVQVAVKANLANAIVLIFLWLPELFLRGLRATLFCFWTGTKKAHLRVKRAQGYYRSAQNSETSPVLQQSLTETHDQALDGPSPDDILLANEDLTEAGTQDTVSRCEACLSDGPLASFLHCPLRHTICTDCLLVEEDHPDRKNAARNCPRCGNTLGQLQGGAAALDPLGGDQLSVEQEGVTEVEGFTDVDRTLELFAGFAEYNAIHDNGEVAVATDEADGNSFVLDFGEEDDQSQDGHGQADNVDQNLHLQNMDDGEDGSDSEGGYFDDTTLRIQKAKQQCIREIEAGKKYTPVENSHSTSLSSSVGGLDLGVDTQFQGSANHFLDGHTFTVDPSTSSATTPPLTKGKGRESKSPPSAEDPELTQLKKDLKAARQVMQELRAEVEKAKGAVAEWKKSPGSRA